MSGGWKKSFGPFENRVWMNASHQGPLPHVAIEAAHSALELKIRPFNVSTSQPFNDAPIRLRAAIANLIGASSEDVILGNSASYGMHVLANGLPLDAGDEVLLVEGDFPSTTFPWLLLKDRGVVVRSLIPRDTRVSPDDVRAALTDRTRVFCTTWVHSFTGYAVDENAIGTICRDRNVMFCLNASQGIGARPLNVSEAPVDAIVSCGFKWQCGPYGTGFCWIRPDLLSSMRPTQHYWLAHLTADELKRPVKPTLKAGLGARAYDVFGTANFNNFLPWTASLELLTGIGIEHIARHDQQLVDRLISGLDPTRYVVYSPHEGSSRSTIVIISHVDPARNERIFDTMRSEGIDHSLRMGRLRFAPHLYNDAADIDRALDVLHHAG